MKNKQYFIGTRLSIRSPYLPKEIEQADRRTYELCVTDDEFQCYGVVDTWMIDDVNVFSTIADNIKEALSKPVYDLDHFPSLYEDISVYFESNNP